MQGRWLAWIFAASLLFVPLVAPQPGGQGDPVEPNARAGPDVVIVVHHPFPDDADPLGIPFGADCRISCDAFVVRHGATEPFRDGIAFPGFIVDGLVSMESLVDGSSFDGTLQAYEAAYQQRAGQDTPVTLRVASRIVDDEARISWWASSNSPLGGGLRAWAALVEDPVHYQPPPALSNGVFEHPFTLRHIQSLGAVNITTLEQQNSIVIPLKSAWETDNLRLAIWVEQDRSALGSFAPGEVIQAVSHPLSSTQMTRQVSRAVLVEAYSASWCQPCLIGDEALEELADAHGLPTGRAFADNSISYLRAPRMPVAVVAVLAVVGAVVLGYGRLEKS